MKRCVGLAAALSLAACMSSRPGPEKTAPPPTTTPTPTAPMTVDALTTAIADDAERSDHAASASQREQLADDALRDADACIALSPNAAGCLYYRGVALGMNAKAHPTRAGELLKSMLESLEQADVADSNIDQGGPTRVKALVLLRAPGWPLGPGDVDAGLTAARRAVSLRPQYPPNLLALGEALSKNGDMAGAHDAYRRAHDSAGVWSDRGDREDWLRAAAQGLAQH